MAAVLRSRKSAMARCSDDTGRWSTTFRQVAPASSPLRWRDPDLDGRTQSMSERVAKKIMQEPLAQPRAVEVEALRSQRLHEAVSSDDIATDACRACSLVETMSPAKTLGSAPVSSGRYVVDVAMNPSGTTSDVPR